MKKLYLGKTKDVYEIDDYHVMLRFKDDVTGKDGVFDPGENQVGLKIDGQGYNNLMMSSYFFNLFESKGIKTHMVKSDSKQEMLVRKVSHFGKGLEVIVRFKAMGSFLRRYGDVVKAFDPLNGLIEFTLKDDDLGDPLIVEDALVALKLVSVEDLNKIKMMTKNISNIIKDVCLEKGLDLIDLKLEFGKDLETGEILLMDEVSSGNMRVYQDGTMVDSLDLAYILEVLNRA